MSVRVPKDLSDLTALSALRSPRFSPLFQTIDQARFGFFLQIKVESLISEFLLNDALK